VSAEFDEGTNGLQRDEETMDGLHLQSILMSTTNKEEIQKFSTDTPVSFRIYSKFVFLL
jgi:hypothetical protein